LTSQDYDSYTDYQLSLVVSGSEMVIPLQQEIGQVLMLLTQDFQRRLDADLVRRGIVGIGARHRSVFLHLAQHGACRSVDLAEAAGIRPQSMMKIVHELEHLGLVERTTDPADSRAKLITFTTSGKRLIRELGRSTETVWRQYAALAGDPFLRRTFDQLQQLLKLSQGEKRP
jgi:DNA-binding MarR family transcriptional regulator